MLLFVPVEKYLHVESGSVLHVDLKFFLTQKYIVATNYSPGKSPTEGWRLPLRERICLKISYAKSKRLNVDSYENDDAAMTNLNVLTAQSTFKTHLGGDASRAALFGRRTSPKSSSDLVIWRVISILNSHWTV